MLVLTGRPSEAQAQVRYLGHRRRSRRLSVLRTLDGAFTSLTLPTSGVVEVSVRYTDPYDVERASPWTTLKRPASETTAGKAGADDETVEVLTLAVAARRRGVGLRRRRRSAAGSYEVSACNFAPEAVNNSWTWATTDPSQPTTMPSTPTAPIASGAAAGTADQEGGLSTTDALGLSSGAAPGTSAGWTFTAPAGTTITGITYERYIGHQSDPDNYWSPALRANGAIVPGETCLNSVANGETCSSADHPAREANRQ